MILNSYLFQILEQLKSAKDYPQVETILVASVSQVRKSQYSVGKFVFELEEDIKKVSPMSQSSTQFSCLRYALVYLHHYVVRV